MPALLPLYRHPTMTVVIDDDPSSLAVLQQQLEQSIARITFTQGRAALKWIAGIFSQVPPDGPPLAGFDNECGERETTAESDLERIYHYVGDPQRFSLPTVLVVDYAMQDMDGLAFCEAVAELPCKKIMFTSRADADFAVSIFNRGLIQRFIRKQQADALDHLESEIDSLQQAYFVEQSRGQIAQLDAVVFSFLRDPAVAAMVKGLCDRYGFVEYYLFTNPHGFLFFDAEGTPTLVPMMSARSLEWQADVADGCGAPPEVSSALRGCRVVPFFHTDDGCWAPDLAGDPLAYCKPAQITRGREHYYWALFDLPDHYRKREPYSHARFLREHASAR
ncbi:response regulator [Massilia antarctica]|uniref:response regulator n=1 Tax=Massilia antarctica TaxID=2765360 RepID=UPI00226E4EDD|nr:response regulator [Massilia sp. H27-R4]MCY0916443.1 response regulator [Massilia sp. H27-R4]